MQLLLDTHCHDVELDVEAVVVRDLKTGNFIFRIHDELQGAMAQGAITPQAGKEW